jgi:hypothetical protein
MDIGSIGMKSLIIFYILAGMNMLTVFCSLVYLIYSPINNYREDYPQCYRYNETNGYVDCYITPEIKFIDTLPFFWFIIQMLLFGVAIGKLEK